MFSVWKVNMYYFDMCLNTQIYKTFSKCRLFMSDAYTFHSVTSKNDLLFSFLQLLNKHLQKKIVLPVHTLLLK